MNFKPFYIKTRDLTKEQVIEVIDKSVEAGAVLYEGVWGVHQALMNSKYYIYNHVGVSACNNTRFHENTSYYGPLATEITFEQLDEHLGLVSKQEASPNKCTELRNVKIDLRKEDGTVDEELSILFQEAVFESGGKWACGKTKVTYTDSFFLFVDSDGEMSRSSNVDTYVKETDKQIKFSAKKTFVWEAEFVDETPVREIITLPNGDKYYADELQEALGKINKVVD